MNRVITEMTEKDLEEVAALEKMLFTLPWSEDGFRSSLRHPDTIYLIVREEGKLVGYCGCLRSFDEADITNVAVHPDHRNQKIGFEMLKELMKRGNEAGIARFTLEVRTGNAAAIHLYEKLGFESVGIRKNFYDRPKEDAMIMWTKEEN